MDMTEESGTDACTIVHRREYLS